MAQPYGGYYNPQPPQPAAPLQFYGEQPGFYNARPHLEGNVGTGGGAPGHGQYSGSIQQTGWLSAFGTGGFEGEAPLLEELGINFAHIRAKTLTVLNPLRTVDEHIMDDADVYGPLIFYFCFGTFLLFSGRPQFGYIYGLALVGSLSIYTLLNLMSPRGIDAYRVASVLGYCLLPMVCISAVSVMIALNKGWWGYFLTALSICWCTYAASGIFVVVLHMTDQRLLVAYPVGLLYGCFGLLSVFDVQLQN